LSTVDGNEGEVRDGSLSCPPVEDNYPELRELADIARRVSPPPTGCIPRGDYPRLYRHSEAAVPPAIASGHGDVVSANPLLRMLAANGCREDT